MPESEFGKGYTYCLGLFLAHERELWNLTKRYKKMREKIASEGREGGEELFSEGSAVGLWFNGAGDHFFEFQAEEAPPGSKKRAKILRQKVLGWRITLGREKPPTSKDAEWALAEARWLLMAADRAAGIKTIKGTWE